MSKKKSLEIQQKLEFQVVKSKKSGIPGVIMLKKNLEFQHSL